MTEVKVGQRWIFDSNTFSAKFWCYCGGDSVDVLDVSLTVRVGCCKCGDVVSVSHRVITDNFRLFEPKRKKYKLVDCGSYYATREVYVSECEESFDTAVKRFARLIRQLHQ